MRTVHSGALKYLYPVIVRVTGLSGSVILIFTFLVFPRSSNTMELDEEILINRVSGTINIYTSCTRLTEGKCCLLYTSDDADDG